MAKVSNILTADIVLTMDQERRILRDGAIAIQDDTIVAVGEKQSILEEYTSDATIDFGENLLMPGLINAHTHVPMTILRGLADDLRLDVWLLGYIMPVEREFVTPEFCTLGTKLACAEMIRGGITTFADMYYFEDIVAQATAQAGMRGICGQTVLKFPSPDAESFEDSLARAEQFIKEWKGHQDKLLS